MKRFKNWIHGSLWAVIFGLGLYVLVKGVSIAGGGKNLTRKTAQLYAPVFTLAPVKGTENQSWLSLLTKEVVPLLTYWESKESYFLSEEPQLTVSFFSNATPIVPPEQWSAPAEKKEADADEGEKEKRRSRRGGRGHRGGRGRGKGSGEGGERAAAPKAENACKKSNKPGGDRPPRNPDKTGERRAPRQSKPNNENPDALKAPRPPRTPKAEIAGDGVENKPRRRSHRGGRGRRRSGGQGGEAPAPKSES